VLVRPLAMQKGLRMRVETPDRPLVLYTDPGKVRQVLVNLLANAVKFSAEGNVVLLVRVDGLDAHVRVIFEVTDQGAGIASEHHERVFEPFWRADPTAKQDTGSTGLGLSVARQLARLLGGDIAVAASTPGRGSTLVFSLPPEYRTS
jgi:signal transduction histidine kinase